LSDEELWELHEEIAAFLTTKIQAAKLKLEKRLGQIQGKTSARVPARRPYPKVYPKFRNPDSPHQTWSGRGLQPHWLLRGAQIITSRTPQLGAKFRALLDCRENFGNRIAAVNASFQRE
jgi:DNA-binding protein H-NS